VSGFHPVVASTPLMSKSRTPLSSEAEDAEKEEEEDTE
jgi:hypothetical protein